MLCSAPVRHSLLVIMMAGLMLGTLISSVGLVSQFVVELSDCSRYTTEAMCDSLRHSKCTWRPGIGECTFSNWEQACYNFTVASCPVVGADAKCTILPVNGVDTCTFQRGWTPAQSGMFASSFLLGCLGGSLTAFLPLDYLGRRATLCIAGLAVLISAALEVAAWESSIHFALLVLSRVVGGLGTGIGSVCGPIYVGEVAPPALRGPIGVLFQLFLAVGMVLVSAMGLAVNPAKRGLSASATVRWMTMYHCYVGACGFAFISLGLSVFESPPWLDSSRGRAAVSLLHTLSPRAASQLSSRFEERETVEEGPESIEDLKPTDQNVDSLPVGCIFRLRSLSVPALTAVVLAIGQTLTGAGAIVAFAPTITATLGMDSLLGSFVITALFFVGIASVPLARVLSPRKMFVSGLAVCVPALIVAGLASMPGIIETGNQKGKAALGLLGIALFVIGFGVGISPSFYVLAQSVFPSRVRTVGCTTTITLQYCLSLALNAVYPVASTSISEIYLRSHNNAVTESREYAQAVLFFVMAAIGALSAACLALLFGCQRQSLNEDIEPVSMTDVPSTDNSNHQRL